LLPKRSGFGWEHRHLFLALSGAGDVDAITFRYHGWRAVLSLPVCALAVVADGGEYNHQAILAMVMGRRLPESGMLPSFVSASSSRGNLSASRKRCGEVDRVWCRQTPRAIERHERTSCQATKNRRQSLPRAVVV
jgi:hypothetical protein